MGFHHVDQADLDLLTSGDLSISASQSAEITGVNHHAQACFFFFETEGLSLCHQGWSAVVQLGLTATWTSWDQVILSPQPPK